MKLISLLFILAISSTVNGQNLFVKKEFCKKSEVEIIAGDCLPKNYVVVGTSSVIRTAEHNSLEDLTSKEKKKLRGFGRMFKSCHVLVDFEGNIMPLQDKEGNDLHKTHLNYYALLASFEF